jgi:hypothetical protein
VLAENPHMTEREIATLAWVSTWTAHNAKKELEQTWVKDPTITYIVNSAKERIKTISRVLDHKAQEVIDRIESGDQIDNKDVYLLKEIAKDDQARVTIFGGNLTDEWWWIHIEKIERTINWNKDDS